MEGNEEGNKYEPHRGFWVGAVVEKVTQHFQAPRSTVGLSLTVLRSRRCTYEGDGNGERRTGLVKQTHSCEGSHLHGLQERGEPVV